MNREIKFRGQRTDNGLWVYGSLVNNLWTYSELSGNEKGSPVFEIITGKYDGSCWTDVAEEEGEAIVSVVPQSVGQFTGLLDKNGKEIYEADIVKLVGGTCDYLAHGIYPDQKYKIGDLMLVQCIKSGFTLCGLNMYDCQIPNRVGKVDNYNFWNHARSLKIIGNVFETPELLNP